MAVWSEVSLSRLASGRRLDAEYYDPEILQFENAVKQFPGGWKTLSEITSLITDGDHLKRNYVDDGLLFLTAENFREHVIDYISDLRISPSYEQSLARSRAEEGAVFLTKTGKWYGKAVVCRSDQPTFNISADVAKIRLLSEHDPYFLACYLNSAIGYALVRRESSGGSRDRIILENLRTLPVPLLHEIDPRYQEIVDRITESYANADQHYHVAEQLLEKALGLDELDLTSTLSFERPYSYVQAAKRYDAEFYQPRMQNLISALSQDGLTIADVTEQAKRKFRPRSGSVFEYIEIADVAENGTINSSTISADNAPSRATWMVRSNDVITSIVRPLLRRTAQITDSQDSFVCSSGFAVLTPESISPELLLVYLRLPLVCELLDLHTTASMYPAISIANLMQIPITLPNKPIRDEITSHIRESFAARSNIQRLVEESRSMVERTILGQG